MKRLLLTLRFDGSQYHGWQVQKNSITIQQLLQDALEQVLGARPGVTGCSRTDSNVHANKYCCHFDTDSNIPCDKFPCAINAHLPNDIAVVDCKKVESDFHSRYSCKGKNYIYKILPCKIRDPFLYKYTLEYNREINVELLNRAAKQYIGTFDYSAFCASGSDVKDKIRCVSDAKIYKQGNIICFDVTADGFLYNMVRIMVGTLLDINEGKIDANDLKDIILSKDRTKAGRTAPPHALYLNEIYY